MNPHYTNTIQKPDEGGIDRLLIKFFNSRFFPYILFLVLVCAVYLRSVFFSITELDDATLVIDRYEYLRDPYNIISSFFKSVFNESGDTFYRPLLTISWIIDTVIGGGRLWVYHLFDVIYHFIAVCVLFNLLKNLSFTRARALIFSSFFAVLPVLNQAVSWIPGRNDTLLAVFILSSFLFVVKYNSSDSLKHMFLSALLFAAALFTKETALAAFPVFTLYLLIKRKNNFIKKTAVLTFVLLFCALTWYLMKSSFTGTGEMNILHIAVYSKAALIKFFPATLQYIAKIFFPVNLKVMPVLSVFDSVLGLLISALAGILIFKSKNANRPNILFGLLWFTAFLVFPYFQNNYFMLEHRVYVAVPGFILILNEIRLGEKTKIILPYLLSIYFIFFITVSFINNNKFSGMLNFSTAAAIETPDNVKTTFLYGRRFLDHGNHQTAGYFMKQNYADITMREKRKELSNSAFLGLFAWQRGDIVEAKKYLTIAADGETNIHQTYAALANIFAAEGRYKEALYNIKKAFKLQPENPEYYRYLKLCFDLIKSNR